MLTFLVTLQPDANDAKALIYAEAAQTFEQAMFAQFSSIDEDFFSTAEQSRQVTTEEDRRQTFDDLLHLSKLYRGATSSSMTPMERFAIMSSASDPSPWESKRVMSEAGVHMGSLETLERRVDAAVAIASGGGAST